MIDILAALSAAVAVLGWGCFAACAWRFRVIRGGDVRRSVLMGAITVIAAGLACQQSLALWAWETGRWLPIGTSVPMALFYRILWAGGLLAAAGAASYPQCGNRAWLALAGMSVAAALASWLA